MDEITPASLRAMNWDGAIPIIISLAPSSLSSPTIPSPQHHLISRMNYLHVGLSKAVQRLHKYAPSVIINSSSNFNKKIDVENGETVENIEKPEDVYPECWFEDEESGLPLRWHLFVGVLYDLMKERSKNFYLPWKIRLHFTAYPVQLLGLDDEVIKTVHGIFSNSLKQALFLQHGSSKKAMAMSKTDHEKNWSAVVLSNYEMFGEINRNLWAKDLKMIPIRVMVDSRPAIQRPCQLGENSQNKVTLGYLLKEWIPDWHEREQRWSIHGIQPSLDSLVIDLWRVLSYPDHFLYITVSSIEN